MKESPEDTASREALRAEKELAAESESLKVLVDSVLRASGFDPLVITNSELYADFHTLAIQAYRLGQLHAEPLQPAAAAPLIDLDIDAIELEWAMKAVTYARQQVCPNLGPDDPSTPYEKGLIQRIAATYRDGYFAACERVRAELARLRALQGTEQ